MKAGERVNWESAALGDPRELSPVPMSVAAAVTGNMTTQGSVESGLGRSYRNFGGNSTSESEIKM